VADRQTRDVQPPGFDEGFTTTGHHLTAVDTGWLLVGAAGICGGLALALVGAGVATSPLLIPVGALVGLAGYLAWVAGSSRIVSTVYEEVGDPDRSASGATGRPGDRTDPTDPDGNWGTAADGGRTAGPDFDHGPGSASDDGRGPREPGSPVDDIWDADERDRVGGWDDWEWADRHWETFEREYDIRDGAGSDGARSPGNDGAGSGGRSRRRSRGRDTTSRQRTDGQQRTNGTQRTGGQRRTDRERDRRTRRSRGRTGRDTGPEHDDAAGGTTGTGGRSRRRERARDRRRAGTDREAVRAREVLGVDADADAAAIQAAYRERAKETHPDRGGDPEAFKRVQWAYEYLTEE
jgi:hypothetical protein